MERRGERRTRQRPYLMAHYSVNYNEIRQRPEFKSAPTLEKQDEIIKRELIPAREQHRVMRMMEYSKELSGRGSRF